MAEVAVASFLAYLTMPRLRDKIGTKIDHKMKRSPQIRVVTAFITLFSILFM